MKIQEKKQYLEKPDVCIMQMSSVTVLQSSGDFYGDDNVGGWDTRWDVEA